MKQSKFKSIVLPIIIWLTASAIVIAFACSFWYIFFGIASLLPEKEEIYHRPASILDQPNCVFDDELGNVYTLTYGRYDFYQYNSDNKSNSYNLFKEEERVIISACTNESSLFVFSHGKSVGYLMDIFNKKMEITQTININYYVISAIVVDNYLYCLTHNYSESKASSYGIIKYNLSSFEKECLTEDVEINSLFIDGQVQFFVQKDYTHSNCELVYIAKNETFFYRSTPMLCYHSIFGKISIQNKEGKIIINCSGQECVFASNFEQLSLYSKVYILDNYLLFGVREYLHNNDCVPRWGDKCFCHFGQSLLLTYDISNNCFLEPITYPAQSILIDYDIDGAIYYHNSGLYNHDEFVRTCRTIDNEGTIIVKDGYYSAEETVNWQIFYHNNRIYGI